LHIFLIVQHYFALQYTFIRVLLKIGFKILNQCLVAIFYLLLALII